MLRETHTQNDGKLDALNQEIRSLKSQISLKDRKLSELESDVHQGTARTGVEAVKS